MELSDKIIVAIIAGGVSFLVSIISFITTVYQNKTSQQKIELELKNKYVNILYEKRIHLYPIAFKITSKIKKINYNGGIISQDQQKNILKNLNAWVENEAGLFLSKEVINAYYNLRKALGNNPGKGGEYTHIQIEKIWKARTEFRSALRSDISNLHKR